MVNVPALGVSENVTKNYAAVAELRKFYRLSFVHECTDFYW